MNSRYVLSKANATFKTSHRQYNSSQGEVIITLVSMLFTFCSSLVVSKDLKKKCQFVSVVRGNSKERSFLAHTEPGLKEGEHRSRCQHHKESWGHLVTSSSRTKILATLGLINEPFHDSLLHLLCFCIHKAVWISSEHPTTVHTEKFVYFLMLVSPTSIDTAGRQGLSTLCCSLLYLWQPAQCQDTLRDGVVIERLYEWEK